MGQTKGIAIRIDSNLLKQIKNHKLSRNKLVTTALKSYLQTTEEKRKPSPKKKESSAWTQLEEESEKLKNISNQNPSEKKQKPNMDSITDDMYNEIYSTMYNTQITPLKKQIQLKDELISTLKKQNETIQKDKQFLFDHIKKLEQRIPKKKSLFKKTK